MALAKLPDGQIVDTSLVETVQHAEPVYGGFEITINLKGNKKIVISCETKEEMKSMLDKVAETLGVGAGPIIL